MSNRANFGLDAFGCQFRAPRLGRGWRSPKSFRVPQIPPPRLDDRLPEIRNDAGLKETRVRRRNIVCAGSSPPHDHPHISLPIGKENRLSCPYCATVYRLEDAASLA